MPPRCAIKDGNCCTKVEKCRPPALDRSNQPSMSKLTWRKLEPSSFNAVQLTGPYTAYQPHQLAPTARVHRLLFAASRKIPANKGATNLLAQVTSIKYHHGLTSPPILRSHLRKTKRGGIRAILLTFFIKLIQHNSSQMRGKLAKEKRKCVRRADEQV